MDDYKEMLSSMSRIFEKIEKEKPFYRLDKGQLDCKSPNTIKQISEYISENTTLGYKSELMQLKSFIIQYLKDSRGIDFSKEEILIVNGCIEGLFVALWSLKNTKKNLLIPEPSWPAYYTMSAELGYCNDLYDFINYEDVENLIRKLNQENIDDTYILLLNSPHNPSGIIIDNEKMKEIVSICDKKNITIISDEVYYEYNSENKKSVSPIEVLDKKDNIIITSSFSKNLSMPGYRVGFIATNKEILKKCKGIHKMITGGISPITQIAVARLEDDYKNYIKNNVEKVAERRMTAIEVLGKENISNELGGIYLFLDCKKNSEEMCNKLLKNGIACVPGTCMGKNSDNFIRIGLIMDKENIKEACEKIKELIMSEE